MSDQASYKRIRGVESGQGRVWIAPLLRRRQAAWLMLATVATGWLAGSMLLAQEPAPIHRRFEVHRTAGGYELMGFRAEVGSAGRLLLSPGMSAADAREQMRSVRWGESYGLRDPLSGQLWGSRVRFQDVVETVAVVLDPTGQFVQSVAYEWQPALFSRFGLGYYLGAAFGQGRPLADDQDHVVMEYGPRGGQRLRVEANRLPGSPPRWRIVFRMDVVAGLSGQ